MTRRRPPRPGSLSELPPLRILFQIAAIQTLYYLAATLLAAFAALLSGSPFGPANVLGWAVVRGDTATGFARAAVLLATGGLIMHVTLLSSSLSPLSSKTKTQTKKKEENSFD